MSLASGIDEPMECSASGVGDSNCVAPPPTQSQTPDSVDIEVTEEAQEVADDDDENSQISSELDELIRLQVSGPMEQQVAWTQ